MKPKSSLKKSAPKAPAERVVKDKHLHDIRGTFCTKLLTEAALSDEEAAGIMGWSVAQVASIRRIYVDQSSLISSIAQRMANAAG